MNQNNDTFFSLGYWMTMLSSLAGLFSLDRIYMLSAVIGIVIMLWGFLDKRSTEKLKRQQIEEDRQIERERLELDRVRAQAVLDYLKGSEDTPAVKRSPEVIQGINKVLDAAKD